MKKLVINPIMLFLFNNLIYSQAVWNQYKGPYMGDVLCMESKGDTLYAGTELSGLFFSTDMGYSWNSTGVLGFINTIYRSDTLILAAINDTPIISRDNGINWEYYPSISSIFQFYNFKGEVYAATALGVFKFDAASNNWIEKSNGFEENDGYGSRRITKMTSVDTILFCGTYKTGMYTSNDKGENWYRIPVSTGLTLDLIRNMINKNDTLIVTDFLNKEIFQSSDTGKTWINIPFQFAQNHLFNDLVIYNDSLILATDKGVYEYSLSTNEWKLKYNKTFDKLFTPDSLLFASNNYGFYRWNKTNSEFIFSNNGINTAYVYDVIEFDSALYAVTRSGAFYTINDGETWSDIKKLEEKWCHTIEVLDTMVFIGTNNGVYGKSANSESWAQLNNGLSAIGVWDLDVNDSTIYAGTDYGLYFSRDYGQNWDTLSTQVGAISKIAIGNNFILAVNSSGLIKLSLDSAKIDSVGFGGEIIQTVEIIDNEVFVTMALGGIYKSVDTCKTWISLNDSFGNYKPTIYDVFKRGDDNVYASSTMYIYYSSDGGYNWDQWSEEGMPNQFIYKIFQSDSCLYAGTFGRSIWKRKYLNSTNCTSEVYNVEGSKSKLQIINNIPSNTTLSQFKENIKRAHGSSIDILHDGVPIDQNGYIKNGDILKVTAEDYKTIKEYTLNTFGELYNIVANVNNTLYGTVSGGGIYESGQEVTLTASALTGHSFINWKFNDAIVSVSPVYVFNAESDKTLTAYFEVVSGVDELENSIDLSVFPNPAIKQINIKLANNYQMLNISLIDNSGKLIKELLVNGKNNDVVIIPVEELAPGIYFLRINNGAVADVRKVIIN